MAPKLGWSQALGRVTRIEAVEEQGVRSWDLVRDAILAGKAEEALQWLRYIKESENQVSPVGLGTATKIQTQLEYISEAYGEEHVEGALRYWRRKMADVGGEPTYRMTPLERLQYHAEMERADYTGRDGRSFEVVEHADRYVIVLDPCGGCGKLRRAEVDGGCGKIGATSIPYSWSWGRAGVPYYCAHYCLWWEVMSIEDVGYPVRVHEWSDDPMRPCLAIFYKSPDKIPEEYFTRVGFEKDYHRFEFS